MPVTKSILNNQEIADIQQPLAKDGWTNDTFDKIYGKNPVAGSDRDRRRRKAYVSGLELPEECKCPRCGKFMFSYQKICGECFMKENYG